MARIDGTDSNNSLYGGDGSDVIQAYDGNDALYGNAGNDVLYGGLGDDKLYAGSGNDTLYGGIGLDQLYGGNGADVLYGNGGDNLWGGTGGDGFVFTSLKGDGGSVQGRIHDFSRGQGDYIRLSAIDANPDVAGDQAFRWLGYDQNGGPADEGTDRAGVSYRHVSTSDGWLTVVDIRSVADAGYNDPGNYAQIWLDGKINLFSSDFIL